MNALYVYTDGCSKSNPGEASIGGFAIDSKYSDKNLMNILKKQPEKFFFYFSRYIGKKSNNQAEYYALLYSLGCLQNKIKTGKIEWENIVFHVDSELVVKQVNGLYKVKHSNLIPIYKKIQFILANIKKKYSVKIVHIRREYNELADFLSNQSITKI